MGFPVLFAVCFVQVKVSGKAWIKSRVNVYFVVVLAIANTSE